MKNKEYYDTGFGKVLVTATFKDVAEANEYLAEHPEEGVVAEEGNLIIIARNDDEGIVGKDKLLFLLNKEIALVKASVEDVEARNKRKNREELIHLASRMISVSAEAIAKDVCEDPEHYWHLRLSNGKRLVYKYGNHADRVRNGLRWLKNCKRCDQDYVSRTGASTLPALAKLDTDSWDECFCDGKAPKPEYSVFFFR